VLQKYDIINTNNIFDGAGQELLLLLVVCAPPDVARNSPAQGGGAPGAQKPNYADLTTIPERPSSGFWTLIFESLCPCRVQNMLY